MKRYVLVWSKAVRPTVMALPELKLRALRQHCYKLIRRAERCLARPAEIFCICIEPLQEGDSPYAAFYRNGHWFKLECKENKRFNQREYTLVFSEEPALPTQPIALADKAAASKRKIEPRGEARPANVGAPTKTSDTRNMFISYKSYNKKIEWLISSVLWPRLARIVQATRQSADYGWRLGRDCAENLCVCLHDVNAIARRIRASLVVPSLGAQTPVSRYGRLEPRMMGQNLGVYYAIVFEEPIGWTDDLFGTCESEGTA